MEIQITRDGFKALVGVRMTDEFAEHKLGEGSLMALADRVAKRCIALSEERGEMSDNIYAQAVAEVAPHFAEVG